MIVSAALVLSVAASALALPQSKRTAPLYAAAHVTNPDHSREAFVQFIGNPGQPTHVIVSGVKGFTDTPGLGPYLYHIHTNPVPADGNCTKTLAHLDPLYAVAGYSCNPGFPQYCEIGDLSGKHGKLNGTSDGKIEEFEYDDSYIRFYPKEFSLLGRSIVIHAANTTRLACGNITSDLDGTADPSHDFQPTYQPSNYVTDYPTVAPTPPGPPVVAFNGTSYPDEDKWATLPYPRPMPALSVQEAPNVKLTSITHPVKFNNTEQTITQPDVEKDNSAGPFGGGWD